ncbi:hypothetical protein [Methylobacterium isbiliense]|uniref:Uncharacterized protein n=1 Tax=Methylobacterium isbiliense TaxID=315478 RepID=A0ABQ4SJ05_9HYPH|nr:hypothetical protein [Methylobacterium isbiliense]MDN3624723.1 hypothetical protein [Methylobacterium isbiliense]GJE02413.1 hypothetical protein GMJLKIPL_4361 [Methylobacterium isbiliense]
MTSLKTLALAAVLAAAAAPAFAQGGSPYNNSGAQAGGPLAGEERAMGARGGTPSTRTAPRKQRTMMQRRMNRVERAR